MYVAWVFDGSLYYPLSNKQWLRTKTLPDYYRISVTIYVVYLVVTSYVSWHCPNPNFLPSVGLQCVLVENKGSWPFG